MITAYYSPTTANRMLVSRLRRRSELAVYTFEPLPYQELDRGRMLQKLPTERSVFIWGNGYRHHESYWFTRGKVGLKANVDQHSDFNGRKRAEIEVLDCATHMDFTANDGAVVIVRQPAFVEPAATYGKTTMEVIEIAKSLVPEFNGVVGLTIDCDGIVNFPAIPNWIWDNGVRIEDVVSLILEVGRNVTLLDFGGLVGFAPAFRATEPTQVLVPEYVESYSYSSAARLTHDDYAELRDMDQDVINKVLSYALSVYYHILNAYAKAIK